MQQELLYSAQRFKWTLLAVSLGVLLVSVFFYPGHTNGDSEWQMQQAKTGVFDNLHPVVMSFVWHHLLKVFPGSAGIFFFQSLVFFLGLALCLSSLTKTKWGFFLGLAFVSLSPGVFFFLSQVYKDVGHTGSLLLAFGLLLISHKRKKLWPIVLCLPVLIYAQALRHNSFPAVIPMLIWGVYMLFDQHIPQTIAGFFKSHIIRLGVALSILLLMMVAVGKMNHWIIGSDKTGHPIQQIFILDLVAISALTGKNHIPDVYFRDRKPYTMEEIRKVYNPGGNFWIHWGRIANREPIGFIYGEADVKTLMLKWLETISSNSLIYLYHRMELFKRHLGIADPYTSIHFKPPSYRGNTQLNTYASPQYLWVKKVFEGIRHSHFFRAWPYFLVACLVFMLVYMALHTIPPALAVVFSSGMLYALAYLVIGITSEHRMMWWPTLASLLVLFVAWDSVRDRLLQQWRKIRLMRLDILDGFVPKPLSQYSTVRLQTEQAPAVAEQRVNDMVENNQRQENAIATEDIYIPLWQILSRLSHQLDAKLFEVGSPSGLTRFNAKNLLRPVKAATKLATSQRLEYGEQIYEQIQAMARYIQQQILLSPSEYSEQNAIFINPDELQRYVDALCLIIKQYRALPQGQNILVEHHQESVFRRWVASLLAYARYGIYQLVRKINVIEENKPVGPYGRHLNRDVF